MLLTAVCCFCRCEHGSRHIAMQTAPSLHPFPLGPPSPNCLCQCRMPLHLCRMPTPPSHSPGISLGPSAMSPSCIPASWSPWRSGSPTGRRFRWSSLVRSRRCRSPSWTARVPFPCPSVSSCAWPHGTEAFSPPLGVAPAALCPNRPRAFVLHTANAPP